MVKLKINDEFITSLQGKDFVTYNGLVDLGHQVGLKSIRTEILQLPTKEENTCIVKAIITTEDDRVFEGLGDANPTNVNKVIARHLIRMAETRAKARALRDLTNVGMTAIEELGGDDDVVQAGQAQPANIKPTQKQIDDLFALSGKDKELMSRALKAAGLKYSGQLTINNIAAVEAEVKKLVDNAVDFTGTPFDDVGDGYGN